MTNVPQGRSCRGLMVTNHLISDLSIGLQETLRCQLIIKKKKGTGGERKGRRGGGGGGKWGKYSYPSNSMYCPIPMYIKDLILLHNNTKQQRNIYV